MTILLGAGAKVFFDASQTMNDPRRSIAAGLSSLVGSAWNYAKICQKGNQANQQQPPPLNEEKVLAVGKLIG